MMLHTDTTSLSGLGADVSQTGEVNNPFWCSMVPSGFFSSCKPPSAEELAVAQDNLTECARLAKTSYPVSSALLGGETACHLVAGDYNGRLALTAAALALLLFVQMR